MSSGVESYSLVEGVWGDFVFRKVQPNDWDKVITHIQDHFMRDEPTCKLLGYSDDFGEEFETLVRKILVDDLSFIAVHKESGEIAAVRVTCHHIRGGESPNYDDIPPVSSYGMKVIYRLFNIMEKMSNIFETYGINEYAEFFLASCDPKYRRRGVTTEMYKRNLAFLKAKGFKLVEVIFTSPYTRAAVMKLGFEEICRLDYTEFVDHMGQLVFNPEDLNKDHFAALMIKQL